MNEGGPPGTAFGVRVSVPFPGANYSPTYGKRAMYRARLMAALDARWKAAQFPLRFRENILLWLVQSFLSNPTSL
jgi:hypothetical protein